MSESEENISSDTIQEGKKSWNWERISTVAIALATVANLFVSGALWLSINQQAVYTKSMFAASQRPFVGIVTITPHLHKAGEGLPYTELSFEVSYKNSGSIIARDVEIKMNSYVNDKNLEGFGYDAKPTIMFPNSSYARGGSIAGKNFDAVMNGEAVLIIESTVTYKGYVGTIYTCQQIARYEPMYNLFIDLGADCS